MSKFNFAPGIHFGTYVILVELFGWRPSFFSPAHWKKYLVNSAKEFFYYTVGQIFG